MDLADGDREIEGDDRRRRELVEMIIDSDDLAPVGSLEGFRIAVHCLDRGLQLKRPRAVAADTGSHDLLALEDQRPVPPCPVPAGGAPPGSRLPPHPGP